MGGPCRKYLLPSFPHTHITPFSASSQHHLEIYISSRTPNPTCTRGLAFQRYATARSSRTIIYCICYPCINLSNTIILGVETLMVALGDWISVWPTGTYFREKRGTKCRNSQKHVGGQTKSGWMNGLNALLGNK